MSLVLDALRRVEGPTVGPRSAGRSVAGHPTVHARRFAQAWPLLSGLLVGGVITAGSGDWNARPQPNVRVEASASAPYARGGAGLPPPPFGAARRAVAEPTTTPLSPSRLSSQRQRPRPAVSPSPPAFVLQAISETDSRLMAVINDQLVGEGDAVGSARVIRIDIDSVLMGWPDGRRENVLFPPPPPNEPTPSPLPR